MITRESILEEAKKLYPALVSWRRDIHEHPETGLNLPRTAGIVISALTSLGLKPQICGTEGTTGVIAVIRGDAPGPTILLRADMDALPIQEQSGVSYESKIPGSAHMCGHDTHTAMLLGAATILTAHRKDFSGQVKLMFQPGEEGQNGARHMIEDGLLKDPDVDAAIAMHCLTGSKWKTGTLLCATGCLAKASSDTFRITVSGNGTHAATPEKGNDVIFVLTQIADGLYSFFNREISPFESAVLSISQIHAGETDNVLPESGFMSGTFRTFSADIQTKLKKRIVEIAGKTAELYDTAAEIQFGESLSPTLNDPALCAEIFGYVRDLMGKEYSDVIGPVTGAEDFSEVSKRIPSVYLDLSFGSMDDGYVYSVHNPKCIFDENAMPIGSAGYAWCAMRWLNAHGMER